MLDHSVNSRRRFLPQIPSYVWVAASAWGSRVVSASVQLVSIRFLLQSLGTDAYSSFVLLGGLLAWATLADMGIGYSLQNYVSERGAEKQESATFVTSAILLILPLLVVALGLLYIFAPTLSAAYLSGSSYLSGSEKTIAFGVILAIFFVTTFGGIAYKVWFAVRLGWLANLVPACGALLGLLNIAIFDLSTFAFPLLAALLLFYAPPAILAALSLYIIWRRPQKKMRRGRMRESILLLKRGRGFWLFAIVATFVLQADYLVMSQRLSASDIVLYSLMLKCFGLASFVYTALLQALWPVCVELRVQQKWSELRRLAKRYIAYAVAGMLCFTALFLVFDNQIMRVLSVSTKLPTITCLLFGLYFVIRAWTDTYSMLLQSMNLVAPLWRMVLVQAVLSAGLQWLLSGWYGMNGMLVGLIASFLLTVAVGVPMTFYANLKRMAAGTQ